MVDNLYNIVYNVFLTEEMLVRSDKNFKMSKQGKISLSRMWNNPYLPDIRKGMIDAEIASKQVARGKREGTR